MTPAWARVQIASRAPSRAERLRLIYVIEPVIAVFAIIGVAPLALVIAVAITIASRRCPVVAHRRVGRHGVTLRMLKFRTMWDHSSARGPLLRIEEVGGYVPASKRMKDPRVKSRFAAWCRRHSLDELPQLYHVARGQMSLVGPRPITRTELDTYYGSSAREVLSVRPGLTGLWQVMGRNRLTYERRRRLDILFVRKAGVGLYLRILVRSLPRVLGGTDAY